MLNRSLLNPVCLLAGMALLASCAGPPARLEVEGFDVMRLVDRPTCYCADTYPAPSLTVWATNPTRHGLTLPINPKVLGAYRSRWWLVFEQDSAELYVLHEGGYVRPQQRQQLHLGVRGQAFCTLVEQARSAGTCSQRAQAVFQNARLVVQIDPHDAPSNANGSAGVLQQVAVEQHQGRRRVTEFDGQY
jgi:hypothetical protein